MMIFEIVRIKIINITMVVYVLYSLFICNIGYHIFFNWWTPAKVGLDLEQLSAAVRL